MSRNGALVRRALVLGVVAAGIGRLVTSGGYTAYVRPGMRIPLLISAAILFVLAVASAWSIGPEPDHAHEEHDGHGHGPGDDDGHGHDHGAFPRIGAWLIVPVVCIAIVPILPLGSGAVDQKRANVLPLSATEGGPPSVVGSGELTLLDFMTRVVTDPANPFTEPVELTGFVASTSKADGEFVLGRFVMSCCAADAQPVLVTVRWDGAMPDEDAWVLVTGTQVPAPPDLTQTERSEPQNVIVEATAVDPVEQPAEPYLSA